MELWKDKNYLYNEFVVNRKSAKEISIDLKVSDSRIEYYLGKYKLYGLRSRVKHTVNSKMFNVDNPIFNYYAGLIATDGYIDLMNNRVSIRLRNNGAKELLESLKLYFQFTGEVREYNGNYDLTITSKDLISELEQLNVIGYRKTEKLNFPNKFTNDDCMRMYLRGVLDGDGNIKSPSNTRRNGQFRLVTASREFIQGTIDCINKKFNTNYSVSIAKVKGIEYPKLEMRVKDSIVFYEWIYNGYPNFRLIDKYNKYQKLISW